MTANELKALIERVATWPEAAQDELVAVAQQIENEMHAGEYSASVDELQVIDSTIASLDAGEHASEDEVKAAFAKFQR